MRGRGGRAGGVMYPSGEVGDKRVSEGLECVPSHLQLMGCKHIYTGVNNTVALE